MQDALLLAHLIGYPAYVPRPAAYHYHLRADVVGKMHMRGGQYRMVVVVLQARQLG
jgi:hypothetical protein